MFKVVPIATWDTLDPFRWSLKKSPRGLVSKLTLLLWVLPVGSQLRSLVVSLACRRAARMGRTEKAMGGEAQAWGCGLWGGPALLEWGKGHVRSTGDREFGGMKWARLHRALPARRSRQSWPESAVDGEGCVQRGVKGRRAGQGSD